MSGSADAQVNPRQRRATILWASAALILTALIYRRLWVGRVLAGGDLHTYFYPYWAAVVRALQQGELPLWNPDLFAGAPLLANSQVGVYYPLNWLCWLGSLIAGGTAQSVTQAIHASVLLHLELAALTMFLLARKLRLSPAAAALAAGCYAGSGFLGVHIEHLNQLQALAWFPLLLLPVMDDSSIGVFDANPPLPLRERDGVRGKFFHNKRILGQTVVHPVVIVAMTMILLAGHTQMAFIALVMLALATVTRLVMQGQWRDIHAWLRALLYWLPLALAALMALAQLVPTFELTGYSARSGGLPWREAVSFSLHPRDALLAWLPAYLHAPSLPESVIAYGLLSMVLAMAGVYAIWRQKQRTGWLVIVLAFLGLFLALGGYNPVYLLLARVGVPGIVHFRAPARYLAITIVSVSLLAGFGLDALTALSDKHWLRFVPAALVLLVGLELSFSANGLPHANATIARAYTDLRPATAHLVSSAEQARENHAVAPRFLSITQTLFEVGDKAEIEGIYASQLSPDALMAYLVSAKQREVLVPNLPLAFNVPAADGYDGGLLPTRYFQQFSKVLLPDGTLDGRLRENLSVIPDVRWLDLLNINLVITDKVTDAWVDDVFYDRQFSHTLTAGDSLPMGWLPDNFTATGVRVLTEGDGVVTARVDFVNGTQADYALQPTPDNPAVLQAAWDASDVSAMTLDVASAPVTLSGITLVDERSGAFYPLVLSPDFRLAHSGDVKIYQRLEPSPRAWVAFGCQSYAEDAAMLVQMQAKTVDFAETVLLSGAECLNSGPLGTGMGEVKITAYSANEVVLDVQLDQPAYLVLADAWYPGWQAEVTRSGDNALSKSVPIARANLFQRAIFLESGFWQVTFHFLPTSVITGAVLSAIGLIAFVVYCLVWKKAVSIFY